MGGYGARGLEGYEARVGVLARGGERMGGRMGATRRWEGIFPRLLLPYAAGGG